MRKRILELDARRMQILREIQDLLDDFYKVSKENLTVAEKEFVTKRQNQVLRMFVC